MRNLKNESGCRIQMSKNQEVYHGLLINKKQIIFDFVKFILGTNERICLVKGKVVSTMMVISSFLNTIQEKIDSNLPSDIYDLKGVDRCKEVSLILLYVIFF